jgi:hypothetical protein
MALFELLTDRKEIRAAQTALEAVLDGGLPLRPGKYTVGYPGGKYETSKLRANSDMWHCRQVVRDVEIPRFWNAFGVTSDLATNRSNHIKVEINSPLVGASGRIGGMFARETGKGYALLHSGKIGGGRLGIGKKEFIASFDEPSVSVFDAARPKVPRLAFIVARLADPSAISAITNFVLAVARFKDQSGLVDAHMLTTKQLKAKALVAPAKPRRALQQVVTFERSAYVALYAKQRANGRCDLCEQRAPFEIKGKPFLECHHIERLADNGDDSVRNTVALCPNCHRRMHLAPTAADHERLRKQAAR